MHLTSTTSSPAIDEPRITPVAQARGAAEQVRSRNSSLQTWEQLVDYRLHSVKPLDAAAATVITGMIDAMFNDLEDIRGALTRLSEVLRQAR